MAHVMHRRVGWYAKNCEESTAMSFRNAVRLPGDLGVNKNPPGGAEADSRGDARLE